MKKITKSVIAVTSTVVGMELVNNYIFKKTPKLDSVLNGKQQYYMSEYGKIFFTVRGEGEPLLLIHGLASGTSSFTWRKNFEELSKEFTVYAIDMPGFGKSQKEPITYKSYMYRNIIKSFMQQIIEEPSYAIASSQSASYIIQLEYDNPNLFKKIIAVCPTGIFELSKKPAIGGKIINYMFKLPIIGTFAYNLLVCEPSIKFFLKKNTYYNKDLVTKYIIDYYKKSARQNGSLSKFAPASFLGGYLNEDIVDATSNIECPILILWGENSQMNSVCNLKSFTDINPDIVYHIFKRCGYLPQEEHPFEFNEICKKFIFGESIQ